VFAAYSSEHVLTTELIEGVPLIELMYRIRDRDDAYLRDIEDRGYDLRRIAEIIDWNTFNQIYVDGLFHADLHPANLFVVGPTTIAYVDFGIVGTLPAAVRESLVQYIRSLVDEDAEGAAAELLRWIVGSERTSVESAR